MSHVADKQMRSPHERRAVRARKAAESGNFVQRSKNRKALAAVAARW
jgi:hypothetical protein